MQKLLHFHLPKTAGTALRHYLAAQLGEQQVSEAIVGMRLADAIIHWEDFQVISGHFSLRQGDALPADRYCLTVLRDPIDRFLSEFFFIKGNNADRLEDPRIHMLDLDAFLESMAPSAVEHLSPQLTMLYPLGTSSLGTLSNEEKTQAAIHALDAFELVGVQEELADFVCMLDTAFCWKAMPLTLKNVTWRRPGKEVLSARQLSTLETLYAGELELYRHAQMRFRRDRSNAIRRSGSSARLAQPAGASMDNDVSPSKQVVTSPDDFGDRRCVIKNVSVKGSISAHQVMVGEMMSVSIEMMAMESIDELTVGIAIRDERGALVFGTNSRLLGNVYSLHAGEYVAQYQMFNRMGHGKYSIDVSVTPTGSHYQGCYHWLGRAALFQVHDAAINHFEGRVLMDPDIEIVATSPDAVCTRTPRVMAEWRLRSMGKSNEPLKEFAAALSPMISIEELHGGSEILVPMRVENVGSELWPASGQRMVVLSYHWLNSNGEVVVFDGLRTRLPADVSAGCATLLPMQVQVPTEKGTFQLLITLVQEGVAWFVDQNPSSIRVLELVIC